jgi:SAM-dependent methyltransferase
MNYLNQSLQYTDPAGYDARHQDPLESYVRTACLPITQQFIQHYIKQGDTVADLGAGTLEHTQHFQKAARIYVVEINPSMLDFGQKKIAPISSKVTLLCEDALHTSIPPQDCDVVWSMGLVEYLDDEKFFQEARRITKPGGLLLVQFQNKFHPVNFLLHLIKTTLGQSSKTYRSLFHTRKIAARYGFRLQETQSRGICLYLPRPLQPFFIPLWKLLDRLYSPFQSLFPLGTNIYCVMQKQ